MSESTMWWLLAGAAVALELVTGTFYLLMIAAGLVAAAISTYFDFSIVGQMVIAAVVGGGGVAAWAWKRSKSPKPAKANANRDVQMDIGETVHVQQWNADATATVKYRGAQWTVVLADNDAPLQLGLFKIEKLNGNRLVVTKV